MRTLDRYIVRSFLTSVLLCLLTMLVLRAVTDLFVNMDEFAEKKVAFGTIAAHVASYYGYQLFAYFAQLGGVTIVAAAGFTLYRMNQSNELTAIMASGVSLYRVLWPIVLCCLLMSGGILLERELLIPRIRHKLVRRRDELKEARRFNVPLLADGNRSVWYSPQFLRVEQAMVRPTILLRDEKYLALGRISGHSARPGRMDDQDGWIITGSLKTPATFSRLGRADEPESPAPRTGWISSRLGPEAMDAARPRGDEKKGIEVNVTRQNLIIRAARYDHARKTLYEARFLFTDGRGRTLACFLADKARYGKSPETDRFCWLLDGGRLFHASDLTPVYIELRKSSKWMEHMSMRELTRLLRLERIPDPLAAVLARHIRITEPLNNLVMLLLGAPFILSRERNLKTSALRSLGTVGAFYAFIYISRYLGVAPIWAAWLPVLVFGPIAAIMLDLVKT